MDAYSVLTEAIPAKQQVVAIYHGEERDFSPHALGTKRGIEHVLVYQFAGGSGLPPEGDWRCLEVAELSDIEPRPGAWHTAVNVFNPQSCLDDIDLVADPLPPRESTRPRPG